MSVFEYYKEMEKLSKDHPGQILNLYFEDMKTVWETYILRHKRKNSRTYKHLHITLEKKRKDRRQNLRLHFIYLFIHSFLSFY